MAKRIDDNQHEIVNIMRKLGASVLILSEMGKGCPDIAVGISGKTYLVEIKDGKKFPSAQRLTDKEKEFHDTWRGHVCIIKSSEQAVEFINQARSNYVQAT